MNSGRAGTTGRTRTPVAATRADASRDGPARGAPPALAFVKLHGAGNDYVFLDAIAHPGLEALFAGTGGPDLVRRMSDRHRGIGSDGVILLCPARRPDAHARMRMFNADGSESEMCGNGVRCLAKFAFDRAGVRATPLLLETGRGPVRVDFEPRDGTFTQATIDMGVPELRPERVPVETSRLGASERPCEWVIPGESRAATFISMGNPHAVIFLDARDAPSVALEELSRLDLSRVGPTLERHPAFPRRMNLHWVVATSRRDVTMRTWERGAGATQACGSGACAAVVGGVATGRLEAGVPVRVRVPGGELTARWDGGESGVWLSGPAEEVYVGQWPLG
ncbi:MAG TPA: diaminopimelate epimerase [Phycisphaerales bacterium]|nr:diaminopimelate epimerase [Phycisphaerales bacterium]